MNYVGCDATYFMGRTVAAAALLDESLHLHRMSSAMEKTRFPYIPGLLAFREGPICPSCNSETESRVVRVLG
jgi:deoxyinosine 3'endonuclease (endonuclease V)